MAQGKKDAGVGTQKRKAVCDSAGFAAQINKIHEIAKQTPDDTTSLGATTIERDATKNVAKFTKNRQNSPKMLYHATGVDLEKANSQDRSST